MPSDGYGDGTNGCVVSVFVVRVPLAFIQHRGILVIVVVVVIGVEWVSASAVVAVAIPKTKENNKTSTTTTITVDDETHEQLV